MLDRLAFSLVHIFQIPAERYDTEDMNGSVWVWYIYIPEFMVRQFSHLHVLGSWR